MSKEKRSAKALDKLTRKAAKKAARIVDTTKKSSKVSTKTIADKKVAPVKPVKPSNLVGKLQALQLKGQTVLTIPVKKKYTPEDLEHIAAVLTGATVKPAAKKPATAAKK